jgi:hypothetical protein
MATTLDLLALSPVDAAVKLVVAAAVEQPAGLHGIKNGGQSGHGATFLV